MGVKKEKSFSENIKEIEVTEDDFDEKVLKTSYKLPVVVDFWSPSCMPCIILAPMLKDLVKEFKGKFILVKVNINENKLLALRYDVMSIPCVKMFKNGKVVDEFVGATSYPDIRRWLEKNLK